MEKRHKCKKILKVQGKQIGKNFNAEIGKVFLNLPQNPEVIKNLLGKFIFHSQKTNDKNQKVAIHVIKGQFFFFLYVKNSYESVKRPNTYWENGQKYDPSVYKLGNKNSS